MPSVAANLSNDRDLGSQANTARRAIISASQCAGCGDGQVSKEQNIDGGDAQTAAAFPRPPDPWPDTTEALAALARAWTVTTIATVFFVVALTIAPVWDGAIYMPPW